MHARRVWLQKRACVHDDEALAGPAALPSPTPAPREPAGGPGGRVVTVPLSVCLGGAWWPRGDGQDVQRV